MRHLPKADALAAITREPRDGCRMCTFARDPEPIATSEHAIAILDRYASRPGHVLVVARRHEERVAALAWEEYASIQRLVWDVCRALEATFAPRRIYVAALGSADALDTSFPHVHVHVVPLADGGELDRPANVFTWGNGVYVFESAAEERAMRDRLRTAFT
jgi:diadenosine tetraphosphate (Ap4A) HIT family hydrolase